MISEIVVVPDCFKSSSDTKSLAHVLNDVLKNGILIVDFSTGNWWKYIHENYINNLDPAYRDKVTAYLRQLKDRKKIVKVTNHNHPITSDDDWIKVTKLHSGNERIKLIVSGSELYEYCQNEIHEKCKCINDITLDEKWDRLKERDMVLFKTPEDYEKTLKSILPHAKKLLIIDPYLEPDSKNKLALQIFTKYFRNREGFSLENGTIEIHTKLVDSLGEETTKNRWRTLLKSIDNQARHTFKIFFWKDNGPDDKFHDRYLLTDVFAITSLHSFSVKESSNQETEWSLKDQKLLDKYANDFSDEDPKFRSACAPLIVTSI